MELIQSYMINSHDYKIINKINSGSFGSVYKVQNKATNEILAAKVATGGSQNLKMINREIKIMIHFNHPTIEKLRGYSNVDFWDNKVATIFMNLEENGSLRQVINDAKRGLAPDNYDDTTRQIILIGIARGMMILHKNNVIHRDLKPENILLDENLHPLITDFGLSKFYELGHSKSQSMNPGTLFYMAPEVFLGQKFDTKADVYAFGILMYEVISEEHPYPSLEKNCNILKIQQSLAKGNLRPKFDESVKKSFQNLLEICCATDPNDRPTFEEIYFRLAYNFDDFIVDDDEDEDKFFLPNVDKDLINDYIKEIEKDNNENDKIVELEKNLIKLQNDLNETKKENTLLRKENKEIKEKVDFLQKKLDESKDSSEFNSKISDEIASIKHDVNRVKKKVKTAPPPMTIPDDLLERLTRIEKDVKKCKGESPSSSNQVNIPDKLFNDVQLAVDTANKADDKCERLKKEIDKLKVNPPSSGAAPPSISVELFDSVNRNSEVIAKLIEKIKKIEKNIKIINDEISDFQPLQ